MAEAPVIWQPVGRSQSRFIACPVFEVLFQGTRGGGKTDCLLMDFAQFIGCGYGEDWRGVLFRRSYPELEDVVIKTHKWFPLIFPKAFYNSTAHTWRFPDGERLSLRHIEHPRDYWKYHGHEIPWIAWEELTNWAAPQLYIDMMACNRSSNPEVPKRYRATCNPYGPGHNWIKARFIDEAENEQIITDEKTGRQRCHIFSDIRENPFIWENDPDYVKNLEAQGDHKKKAWLYGDWNIVAGGMFDDLWKPEVHIVEPFAIPTSWHIDRAMDWGSAKPYAIAWFAESDGRPGMRGPEEVPTKAGDIFMFAEDYGWNGNPNEGCRRTAAEVAQRVVGFESDLEHVVTPGPADSSIYVKDSGDSIAEIMERNAVRWDASIKGAGSRVQGAELIRQKLQNSINKDSGGLYFFSTCRQAIRTVPVLPRDDKKPDDVDTDAEDHIYDMIRYRLAAIKRGVVQGSADGMF